MREPWDSPDLIRRRRNLLLLFHTVGYPYACSAEKEGKKNGEIRIGGDVGEEGNGEAEGKADERRKRE